MTKESIVVTTHGWPLAQLSPSTSLLIVRAILSSPRRCLGSTQACPLFDITHFMHRRPSLPPLAPMAAESSSSTSLVVANAFTYATTSSPSVFNIAPLSPPIFGLVTMFPLPLSRVRQRWTESRRKFGWSDLAGVRHWDERVTGSGQKRWDGCE